MTETPAKIRLYVDAALGEAVPVTLTDQAHYLTNVMRQGVGDAISLFNGRDGEWRAEITAAGRREVAVTCQRQTAPQSTPPDLWLLFAPVKKARTDSIVEKATELGAARLQPVFTRFTNSERVRPDRLRAHAIEAAEQCGETYVPEVDEPLSLSDLLDAWPTSRRLMFCDEARTAAPAVEALADEPPGPWAILIGPEGGFAAEETHRLRGLDFVRPVALGPRILRADTAAAAALTAWQSVLGDWR